jgi:hypothetical protein
VEQYVYYPQTVVQEVIIMISLNVNSCHDIAEKLLIWHGVKSHFQQYFFISWQSVLLVEEIRIPGENHQPAASH